MLKGGAIQPFLSTLEPAVVDVARKAAPTRAPDDPLRTLRNIDVSLDRDVRYCCNHSVIDVHN